MDVMQDEAKPAKSRKRWPMWGKVLLGLVGLAVLVVGLAVGRDVASQAAWEAYMQELMDRGEPLTYADIDKLRPAVPDERNSALLILKLLPKLEAAKTAAPDDAMVVGWLVDEPADWRDGTPRSFLKPTRAFRDQETGLLAELYGLRDRPTGRLPAPVDGEGASMAPLATYWLGYRFSSNLLELDTRLRLIDGDAAGAVASTDALVHLFGGLNTHPFLLSFLVQRSCQVQALRVLEMVLGTVEVDGATLARWQVRFQDLAVNDGFYWGLLGERVYGIQWADRPLSALTSPTPAHEPVGYLGRAQLRYDMIQSLRNLDRVLEITPRVRESLSVARSIERDLDAPGLSEEERTRLFSLGARPCEMRARSVAAARCAAAALAAERYRLATGAFPTSLTQLVPDYIGSLPFDPFDGKPMKLAPLKDKAGIVIYSIGPDENDDGGQVIRRNPNPEEYDIGFRVFKPEARGYPILDAPE
jgi:hypothetical protein